MSQLTMNTKISKTERKLSSARHKLKIRRNAFSEIQFSVVKQHILDGMRYQKNEVDTGKHGCEVSEIIHFLIYEPSCTLGQKETFFWHVIYR